MVRHLKLGEIYNKISKEGFRVLSVIDSMLPRYEYVPQEVIFSKIKVNPNKLMDILEQLVALSLVKRKLGSEVGYRLTYLGLNVLSLKSLVDRGVIEAVGDKIGVGKESEIYEALSPTGARLSIKFHCVGKESFKKLVKVRSYAASRSIASWLIESKLNAAREYKAITILSQYSDMVQKPYGYSRNAVATEFVEGVELYKLPYLSNPKGIFERIIEVITISYACAGIIHGDLSEYNVIIRLPDEKPIVIDWPQYITKEMPGALEVLKRDICYISKYFNKRFGLNVNCNEIYEKIIAESLNFKCDSTKLTAVKGSEHYDDF